jgi:hypothetical protein
MSESSPTLAARLSDLTDDEVTRKGLACFDYALAA